MEQQSAPVFVGTPKKIRLVSNNFGYGPWPEADEEIEQRLTVTSEGRVWFSGYGPSIRGNGEKLRSSQSKIDQEIGAFIVRSIAERFAQCYEEEIVMDAGSWKLELTNTDGQRYRYQGPLCEACDKSLNEFSKLIRYHLGPYLFAFDGIVHTEGQIE